MSDLPVENPSCWGSLNLSFHFGSFFLAAGEILPSTDFLGMTSSFGPTSSLGSSFGCGNFLGFVQNPECCPLQEVGPKQEDCPKIFWSPERAFEGLTGKVSPPGNPIS